MWLLVWIAMSDTVAKTAEVNSQEACEQQADYYRIVAARETGVRILAACFTAEEQAAGGWALIYTAIAQGNESPTAFTVSNKQECEKSGASLFDLGKLTGLRFVVACHELKTGETFEVKLPKRPDA